MLRALRPIARLFGLSLGVVLLIGTGAAQAAPCIGSDGRRCAYDRIATYGQGAPGELHMPMGVAVSRDGHVYVVDTTTRVDIGDIDVYDRDGRFTGALTAPGVRFAAIDVGVSANGAVYALERTGYGVHRFDPDGRHTTLTLPYGLNVSPGERFAVNTDGTFWVLYRDGKLQHHAATGAVLSSISVSAANVTGIGVADGHVFVGYLNNGFTEYAPNGAVLGTIGSLPGYHLAFAGDGDLISSWGSTISRAERDGSGYTEIGSYGSAPGQVSQVEGIAVVPPGTLAAQRPGEEAYVVADRENRRVQVIAPDGTALAIFGAPQGSTLLSPRGAWGMPDGGMVVADGMNRRLVRFAATGAFAGRADGGLDGFPSGGAYDPASGGSVIVDGAFAIRRFGAGGALLGGWPMPGVVEGQSNSGFGGAVAVAEDGTIWAAHSPQPHGGHVVAYSPDGTPRRRIADPHIDRPIALATGPGGELYVVEGGGWNSSVVDVFGPDGAFRRRLGALSCLYVQSIAVDGAGRIYAGLDHGVAVLDRSGALLARFGALGNAIGQFDGTQLSVLGDVLTITEEDNDRVTRVRIDPAALGAREQQPCGSVVFAATTIAVKGAQAQVPLGCNGTLAAACDGAIVLLRSSVKPGLPVKKKDILATASYRVGRAGIVALKLKQAERRTLKRKRRLKARLVVQPRQGAPISRRVTLKAPKKPVAKKTKKSPKKRR